MMSNIAKKIDQAVFSAFVKFNASKAAREERGDTNFISILIILGLVIGMATLFIKFKDDIVGQVQGIVEGFSVGGDAPVVP